MVSAEIGLLKGAMSALGHKRTCAVQRHVRFVPKADMPTPLLPRAGERAFRRCPNCAFQLPLAHLD